MSNSLSGSEKMKRPSIRIHKDLLDEFDDHWGEAGYDSRNAAVIDLIEQELDSDDVSGPTESEMLRDERLRDAYTTLLDAASEPFDCAGLRVALDTA
jgi:hypothetical protein